MYSIKPGAFDSTTVGMLHSTDDKMISTYVVHDSYFLKPNSKLKHGKFAYKAKKYLFDEENILKPAFTDLLK